MKSYSIVFTTTKHLASFFKSIAPRGICPSVFRNLSAIVYRYLSAIIFRDLDASGNISYGQIEFDI
jgi:hypothetical protein